MNRVGSDASDHTLTISGVTEFNCPDIVLKVTLFLSFHRRNQPIDLLNIIRYAIPIQN